MTVNLETVERELAARSGGCLPDNFRLQARALQQVSEAGRNGLLVNRGAESVTQIQLVDDGLIYQEASGDSWKFTLSSIGERVLGA
jgi:hypothetical protein